MIFELLDARRKRIATVTGLNLVDGVISRDLKDRFVKDSIQVEFSLKMKDLLEDAMFLMVSDTGYLRGSPVFRVYQKEIRDTIKVVATSYTTEDLGGYLVDLDELFRSGGDSSALLMQEFVSAGFNLILDGVVITSEDLQMLDYQLPSGEAEIREVLDELMLILDVYGEFVFTVEKDEIVRVGIRLAKQLGRKVNRGLIEGVNITDRRVEERREGIITAVEYTGEETVNTAGEVIDTLTLNGAGQTVLPKSKRNARVVKYVDENEVERYILEDRNATRQYGIYDYNTGEMRPVIESYSDVYINNLDDLLQEAVVKLDGKSVPKTQYNISANVSGLDVGDVVEVQIPQLKIDRYLDVISVTYTFNRRGRVNVTVGEHIATELERRFDEIGVDNKADVGGLPVDVERGKKLATIVEPRTIVYTRDGLGGDEGHFRDRANWVLSLSSEMYPDWFDYYVNFDYTINEGYSGGHFSLGLTYRTTALEVRGLTNNSLPEEDVPIIADVPVGGTSGSAEIRLNDFFMFMNPGESYDISSFSASQTDPTDSVEIRTNNFFVPIFAVYDSVGNLNYLPYLHYNKYKSTTQEELNELSGYITDFTITGHERTTKDPLGFKERKVLPQQITLDLDFTENKEE